MCIRDSEAPRLSCDHQSETEKGKPMYEITRGGVVRVGVDLAKRVIQVHAVDAAGRRVVGRALKREQFMAWCVQLPAACLVAMEACSSAHHWTRKLRALGQSTKWPGDASTNRAPCARRYPGPEDPRPPCDPPAPLRRVR